MLSTSKVKLKIKLSKKLFKKNPKRRQNTDVISSKYTLKFLYIIRSLNLNTNIYYYRHESKEIKNNKRKQEERLFEMQDNNENYFEMPSAYDNFIRIYAIYSEDVNPGICKNHGFKQTSEIKKELIELLKPNIIIKRVYFDKYVSLLKL